MDEIKNKVIMYGSSDAAEYKSVEGWFSSTGRFFGNDEHMAMYAGCTHVPCDCGNVTEKLYTECVDCRAKSVRAKYNSFLYKEWDGKTPLCLYREDQFFFDVDDIEEYLESNDMEPEDLDLIICDPEYPHELTSEYWSDSLPEDGDIPETMKSKLKEFNEFLATMKPLSWVPSKVRTSYSRE